MSCCSGGKMKKLGFTVFIVALILGIGVASFVSWGKAGARLFNISFNMGGVHGSGNVTSETRDVSGFHGVDVSGVFDVEIVAQKEFSVQVEADDNLLEYIKTEVDDGILEISTSRKIKSSEMLKVRIGAPDIDNLSTSGVAKISLVDLKNEGLKVDSSGASKMTLAGETDKLMIDVSGAAKIDAEGLRSRAASVDSSGASKISVFATDSVRVKASGASKITYTGGATDVVSKTSGAGSVTPK